MKNELQYFLVDNIYYGGWQEWFPDYMMRLGGCAAVTACDCSIYFELYKNTKGLYPFDKQQVTRNDYIKFAVDTVPTNTIPVTLNAIGISRGA